MAEAHLLLARAYLLLAVCCMHPRERIESLRMHATIHEVCCGRLGGCLALARLSLSRRFGVYRDAPKPTKGPRRAPAR